MSDRKIGDFELEDLRGVLVQTTYACTKSADLTTDSHQVNDINSHPQQATMQQQLFTTINSRFIRMGSRHYTGHRSKKTVKSFSETFGHHL